MNKGIGVLVVNDRSNVEIMRALQRLAEKRASFDIAEKGNGSMLRTLDILQQPHPDLARVCEPVTVFDHALRQLASDMLYTIGPRPETKWQRTGVGLAAPQVGQLINLVVIAALGFPELAMVNPVIEKVKGWEAREEGCLSLPGARGEVYRFTDITVSFQYLDGAYAKLKARDYQARVIQHEIDHLSGIEFTDRIREQLPEEGEQRARALACLTPQGQRGPWRDPATTLRTLGSLACSDS